MAELNDRKATLIARLERARAEMSAHNRGALAHSDLSGKMRVGFMRHRGAWLGFASLFGLLLAKLPPRTKKVVVNRKGDRQLATAGKAGLLVGALKLAIDFAKPLLIAWATKRIGDVARTTKRAERKIERTERKVDTAERQV